MKEKKPQKEKIKYIDDGRTIADMSNVSGGEKWTKKGTTSTLREIWETYWCAVKMMFKPMLVVFGFILAVYLIITVIFWIM